MGAPWNDWHHREHVEGDYKNPPPPCAHEEIHRLSKSLLKRPPVRLAREALSNARGIMQEAPVAGGTERGPCREALGCAVPRLKEFIR